MQFTCSIKQIKGHLNEYVSPSKASNNCLIQFSPATYKDKYVDQICSNMFNYMYQKLVWLTFPHKEIYAHKKCGNGWLSTQNILALVFVMHFPSIPLHVVLSTQIQTSLVYTIANTPKERSAYMYINSCRQIYTVKTPVDKGFVFFTILLDRNLLE